MMGPLQLVSHMVQKHSVGVALIICINFNQCFSFTCYFVSDVHKPLSQIRVSLAGSLGAGQLTFLAGINQTGNKVMVYFEL